ncbi:MAG TPA: NAD-dependent epimerase/dehydratase family protein [Pseudonocardiaceae bacterium]|jgi:UDP-glucose 4-epimerase
MAQPCAGQRVLVTGGCGFVGRSVVAAFQALGAEITVVDQRAFPDERVTTVIGDLTDPELRSAAMTPDVTGVVHLAAITSVLRSAEAPAETFTMNVEVTQGLLELARQRGINRFVLGSTNAVVGNVGSATITEDIPLRPLTPYGATKAACEMLLSGYAGAYGLTTAALRFTNIYGPGMEAKDSFVPRLMRAALNGTGVQIYGDGKQVRDLVHVHDIVAGITAAWQREFTGTAIIGSGRSVSVLDMIDAARQATGADIPVEHIPAKTGEMPAVIVDISKARRELGYEPSYSLADGLRTVWDDFTAAAELTASR